MSRGGSCSTGMTKGKSTMQERGRGLANYKAPSTLQLGDKFEADLKAGGLL